MKDILGFRTTEEIEAIVARGVKRTGCSRSHFVRLALLEGAPIVLARFIGAKKTTGKKI